MPQVDGIVSNIDTTGLINAIIAAQKVPLNKIEDQISDYQNRREKVAGVSNRMKDLQAAIEKMDTEAELRGRKATLSSTDQFDMSLGASAAFGNYSIRVTGLSSNETEVSQGYAAKDTLGTVPEGTLVVTYAGTPHTITVDSTNSSLSGLADELSQVAGLNAAVVDTGETGANRYRLMVSGEDTGASNTISFDTSGLTGLTGTLPVFTEKQTAADATISLNGVTVKSATNTFTDVLPGISLTAKAEGSTAVKATIAQDAGSMLSHANAFVKAYNDVLNYYNTNTAFNADENIAGPLLGEGSTRRAVEQLGQMVADQYSTGGEYTALSQFGFSTDRDGVLSLDESKFTEALADHEDEFVSLFTSDTGPLPTMRDTIANSFIDAETGTLASVTDSLESTIKTMQEYVDDQNDKLDAQAESLRSKFTTMEQVLGNVKSSSNFLAALFGSSG